MDLPAYCINLDAEKERWQKMCRRFERFGLPAPIRWSASTMADIATAPFNPHLRDVERAAALSHFRLWRHLLGLGVKQALILEDDAVFRHDWMTILKARMHSNAGWHALFLNASEPVLPHEQWVTAREQYLAGAYVISRGAMEWLVAMFGNGLCGADYMTLCLQRLGMSYTYFPWLVIQEGASSAIQSAQHLRDDAAKVRRLLKDANYDITNYVF